MDEDITVTMFDIPKDISFEELAQSAGLPRNNLTISAITEDLGSPCLMSALTLENGTLRQRALKVLIKNLLIQFLLYVESDDFSLTEQQEKAVKGVIDGTSSAIKGPAGYKISGFSGKNENKFETIFNAGLKT